jgi:hypothetical protein
MELRAAVGVYDEAVARYMVYTSAGGGVVRQRDDIAAVLGVPAAAAVPQADTFRFGDVPVGNDHRLTHGRAVILTDIPRMPGPLGLIFSPGDAAATNLSHDRLWFADSNPLSRRRVSGRRC